MIACTAIAFTIAALILVATNTIKSKWYSLIIYIIGLFTLYSTTLVGLSVVGSDISRELLMSNLALQNGWNLNLIDPSNSSFVVGLMIPAISLLTTIPPVWLYKVLLPIVFALTPVLLYLIFKKQFGEQRAFYTSMFFIIMPVFSLEIASIGKAMIAETLMALCLWIMFTEWRVWIKCIGMLLATLLTLWAHYTVGVILIAYMCSIILVMLTVKLFKNWKLWAIRAMPLWIPIVIVIISVAGFYSYYSKVSQGLIWNNVKQIGSSTATIRTLEKIAELQKTGAIQTMSTDPLIKIGIGTDFVQASISGKIFRMVQYIIQALIVIGSLWLAFRHKLYKFRAEFTACIVASYIMLLCCIFIPSFASTINMTRYYHMSLFFLTPMLLLGVDALCLRKQSG